MLRGISSNGPFRHVKQCIINAFDTNYLLSAKVVLANRLHVAQNMDDDLSDATLTPHDGPAPPIYAFVAAGRNSHGGRGHNTRGGRGGRGLPNKCSACGSLNHIMSSCIASADALLKWTLAKRKMIIQTYDTFGGTALAQVALLCDVPIDDPKVMPTLEECIDEYDESEVSIPFSSGAFSSFLAPGRDLSQIWVKSVETHVHCPLKLMTS
jgi:hypothetical protein